MPLQYTTQFAEVIFHEPVSFLHTATVERHCIANMKYMISEIVDAVVKSGVTPSDFFASRIEDNNEPWILSSSSSVIAKVIAIELTKTSLAAKAEISDTPIRQSHPNGVNKGSNTFLPIVEA
jgi:hypothetical protein